MAPLMVAYIAGEVAQLSRADRAVRNRHWAAKTSKLFDADIAHVQCALSCGLRAGSNWWERLARYKYTVVLAALHWMELAQ
jgi:hypothetical protein